MIFSRDLGLMEKNYLCLVSHLESWLEIFLISQSDYVIIKTIEMNILDEIIPFIFMTVCSNPYREFCLRFFRG